MALLLVFPLAGWSAADAAEPKAAQPGPAAKSSVPELRKALGDTDAYVRVAAARYLATVKPEAAAAVSELLKALNDNDEYVRFSAAKALDKTGYKPAKSVQVQGTLLVN